MKLLRTFLPRDREFELHENRVRLFSWVIGRMADLPQTIQRQGLQRVMNTTTGAIKAWPVDFWP